MSLTVSEGNSTKFEILPMGTYVARCFKIIDLGTQQTEWQGEKKLQRKVLISWEILDDDHKMADGRPFAVTKKYTASLHEKAQLRKDLEAWRGRPFTPGELANFLLTDVMGAYCMMQIVHNEASNGNTYANMNSIMSTKEKPTQVNPNCEFDVDVPDMKVFETFSENLQEQIKQSVEWQAREAKKVKPREQAAAVLGDVQDEPISLDDIPF